MSHIPLQRRRTRGRPVAKQVYCDTLYSTQPLSQGSFLNSKSQVNNKHSRAPASSRPPCPTLSAECLPRARLASNANAEPTGHHQATERIHNHDRIRGSPRISSKHLGVPKKNLRRRGQGGGRPGTLPKPQDGQQIEELCSAAATVRRALDPSYQSDSDHVNIFRGSLHLFLSLSLCTSPSPQIACAFEWSWFHDGCGRVSQISRPCYLSAHRGVWPRVCRLLKPLAA